MNMPTNTPAGAPSGEGRGPEPFSQDIRIEAILLKLLSGWRIIAGAALVSVALAAVYAFLVAKPVYRSTAILIPTESVKTDQLGAAALLMNKKVGGISEEASLYQTLLASRTVVKRLLETTMPNRSDSGGGRLEPVHRILGVDTLKRSSMSRAEATLMKAILVDTKDPGPGQVVEVSVDAGSPWLAQLLCDSVIQIGQRLIREVRVQRYHTVMDRLSKAVEQSRSDWDSAAQRIADFQVKNRSVVLPAQNMQLMRLNMDLQAKEQRYMVARKELEMQDLEVEKATPPMLLLEPSDLPSNKMKPKRGIILLVGAVAGAFLASAWVLLFGNGNPLSIRRRD